jgi:mono/diheme cytochrome c family protein
MKTVSTLITALLLTLILVSPTAGTSEEADVDFARDVWPIFAERCVSCHGPMNMGKLRLDSKERILKGGAIGQALVPGKPEESSLMDRVTLPADDFSVMPAEGDPLTAEQIETLEKWIAAGAEFGDWIASSE